MKARGPVFCRWLAAAALAAICGAAVAQTYPSKPIRFFLPFAPGGIGDLTARLVAQKMSENLGQQVVVDNKPSAGMILSATAGLQAPADGYTMVLAGNGTAISATLFKSLPYSILTDFTQVSTLAAFDLVVLVPPDSRFASLGEVVAFGKNNPGKLNLGTVSIGSTQNLSAELFKSVTGIDAQIVPFKGTPSLIAALRSNSIDVVFEFVPPMLSQIRGSTVKALAIASAKRFPGLPATPTTAESGLPAFQVSSWNAVSVRANTSRAIVDRLNREIVAALNSPEVKQKLQDLGAEARPSTPEQTRELMVSEIARWKAVIERANIPRQ